MKVVTFLFSFVLTFILTHLAIKLSYKKKILDYPKKKSVHTKPTPMIGGVVIFFVFFFISFILNISEHLFALFIASLPIVISGIYDDVKGMSAAQKFLVQLISCIILISFGIVVEKMKLPFGPIIELGIFAIPATIFWFIFMTNLFNIIDGLDGLAAGLSAIILLILISFGWAINTELELLILLGAILSFLLFNFYPAKIFLGNNGSTFIGFVIAFFALITSQKSTVIPILFLPCIVLFTHIIDVGYAIIRRAKKQKNIFSGDQRHIHHLLLNTIGNHSRTVLIFYLISLILAFIFK